MISEVARGDPITPENYRHLEQALERGLKQLRERLYRAVFNCLPGAEREAGRKRDRASCASGAGWTGRATS